MRGSFSGKASVKGIVVAFLKKDNFNQRKTPDRNGRKVKSMIRAEFALSKFYFASTDGWLKVFHQYSDAPNSPPAKEL